VVTLDALYMLQSLVRTKTTGADGNFNQGRISDAKLDNTIDAMKIATDPVARDALIKEALIKTRDEHYYVPLHYQMRPWAMKKNVTAVYNVVDTPESRYAVVK
jgi:peptide/nickel transport system substrate-binding protein